MIYHHPKCLLKHLLVAKNKLCAIPKNSFDLYKNIRLLCLDEGPTETGAAVFDFNNDHASHLDVLRFKNLADSSIEGIGRHIGNIVKKHEIDAIILGLPLPLVSQIRLHPYPDPSVSPALLASLVPDPYWGLNARELASPAYSGVRRVYHFANCLRPVLPNVLFTFQNEATTTDQANEEFLLQMKDLATSALTLKDYGHKELLKQFVRPVFHRHIEAAFGGFGSFEPEDLWYDPAIRRSWSNMEAAKIIVETYRVAMEKAALEHFNHWSRHLCVQEYCSCFGEV